LKKLSFKTTLILSLLYVVAAVSILVYLGISIYPDRLLLIFLVPALLMGRVILFIRDWIPFVVILLSYEFLRGFADTLTGRVHYHAMINFDSLLFGTLPTVWLQDHLFNPNSLHIYDYVGTLVYLMHFVVPFVFGLILWLKNRHYFLRFSAAFLLLSFAGLATYVIFPAAPPWLASQQGYAPHIYHILSATFQSFPDRLQVPTIYQTFNPNAVAAMPSLHAAYPTLVLLFLVRFFGKKGLFFIPYVLAVWLMIVYFGEHYVSDVLAGVIYASAAFVTVEFVLKDLHLNSFIRTSLRKIRLTDYFNPSVKDTSS
jgi:hypothetical protein